MAIGDSDRYSSNILMPLIATMTMFEFINDEPETNTTRAEKKAPGKVRFDDRGNAIYQWNDLQLATDDKQGEQLRERALLNSTLSLVDDSPAPDAPVARNDKGLHVGYNPYESGQLGGKKSVTKKKHDIRELSKWIELQRRLGMQKDLLKR